VEDVAVCGVHLQSDTKAIAIQFFSSSMSTYFALLILIAGSLFSCSATTLETKKLALKELSQTVTPPVISLTSGEKLNGYFGNILYRDKLCKDPFIVRFTILNSCFSGDKKTSRFYTANSTTLTSTYYKDTLCTVLDEEFTSTLSARNCSSGISRFISPTGNWITDSPGFRAR
jgi:hypothetical protein